VSFKSEKAYGKHICRKKRTISKKTEIKCSRCHTRVASRQELHLHIREVHLQKGAGVSETINIEDAKLLEFYNKYRSYIYEDHDLGQPQSFYNFALDSEFSIDDLMSNVEYIYKDQSQSFRLNMAFGVILQHTTTNEFRYFKAYTNDPLFQRPLYISLRKHILRLKDRLTKLDISKYMMRARKDTKWKPVMVTNVRYYITSTGYVLGHGDLPVYISASHSILSLTKDYHRNSTYNDNLCLFRALTFHKYGVDMYKQTSKFEQHVRKYFREFNDYMMQDFHAGVDINFMPDFHSERRWNCNASV
jgi:hypothetical protein